MILLVRAICWPLNLFYGVFVEIYVKVMQLLYLHICNAVIKTERLFSLSSPDCWWLLSCWHMNFHLKTDSRPLYAVPIILILISLDKKTYPAL